MRSLLIASCLAVLACAFVPAVNASPPSPSNSTGPGCILVVGENGAGVVDPLGEFVVTYRDLANQPVANALIVVDFSGCPELRLCSNQHDPAMTVNCAARTVSKLTNAAGTVHFRVMGWSVAPNNTPGAPYNSGKIFADGNLLFSPTISMVDLDKNGLNAADLSFWLGDFFGGNNPARGDYDCSGSLGAADLAVWLKVFFAGGSIANCAPEGPCP